MELKDKVGDLIMGLGLTSSQFADEVGISRPIISHILNGRNKPSLEIIQKIVTRFPEIGYDWINDNTELGKALIESIRVNHFPDDLKKEPDPGLNIQDNFIAKYFSNKKPIKNIIIFYEDQTFELFEP